jgi:hypothetical protein
MATQMVQAAASDCMNNVFVLRFMSNSRNAMMVGASVLHGPPMTANSSLSRGFHLPD